MRGIPRENFVYAHSQTFVWHAREQDKKLMKDIKKVFPGGGRRGGDVGATATRPSLAYPLGGFNMIHIR